MKSAYSILTGKILTSIASGMKNFRRNFSAVVNAIYDSKIKTRKFSLSELG